MAGPQTTTTIDRAAIKKLMASRMTIVEDLAAQLDKWQQAKAAEQAARDKTAAEAAAARASWDKALASGWTAKELTDAGLKPPASPRGPKRTETPSATGD